eukprot:4693092-Pyramimonas_sp.AAC.1
MPSCARQEGVYTDPGPRGILGQDRGGGATSGPESRRAGAPALCEPRDPKHRKDQDGGFSQSSAPIGALAAPRG